MKQLRVREITKREIERILFRELKNVEGLVREVYYVDIADDKPAKYVFVDCAVCQDCAGNTVIEYSKMFTYSNGIFTPLD